MPLPILRTRIPGPKSQKLLKDLRRWECPHVTYGSRHFPVFVQKSSGTSVTDVDGNRFLDLTSFFAVSGLGHAPAVLAPVLERSAREGWHAMGDVHPHAKKLEAARALASFVPGGPWQVYFSLNGSDAVETAFKTAFLATRKPGVIAFRGAYHGLGYGAMQATHRAYFREPFLRQAGEFVRFLPGVFGSGADRAEIRKNLDGMEKELKCRGRRAVGAVILEPIQGRAGIRPADPVWLRGVRTLCRRYGVLLIFDEIYTGFARTGRWFAFEEYGVRPDILCVGKGMAGGIPVSACLASPAVFKAWGPSPGEARHTSTFLGNPLGSAMVCATLRELRRIRADRMARDKGAVLGAGLAELAARYPGLIREIRGRGLMWGVEMRDPSAAHHVVVEFLKRGILILGSGARSEVISLTPPFVLDRRETDFALASLEEVLSSFQTGRRR
ncbi:MAG: aspartate aminotransferase family protein [Candidatus Omnitrophica bacterium]|nr:aspartate aminotransferase family protein [Candidatus Omnitrophota bacterium]